MSPKSSRTIHVYSDGTPESTRVLNNDGAEIKGVRKLTIDGDTREAFLRITLEVLAPTVDADGILDSTILTCPVCRDQERHQCRV